MADKQPSSPVAKTEVWTLGLLGVDVVNGPLHLVDGDLIRAQNAEPFAEEGEGGLRKRLGIDQFTPDDLGSPIAAITSIPLPDPTDDWFGGSGTHFAYGFGGTTRKTTNGSSWSTSADPVAADALTGPNEGGYVYQGQLYYASSAAAGRISRFDGDLIETVIDLPGTVLGTHTVYTAGGTQGVVQLCGSGTTLYATVLYSPDGGINFTRVIYAIDIDSAVATKFCEGFKTGGAVAGYLDGTSVLGPVAWNGRVWLAVTTLGPNALLYSADPSDSTWTLDTTVASRAPTNIYGAGATSLWWTTGGASDALRKRTVAGAHSIVIARATWTVYAVGDRVYIVDAGDLKVSTDDGATFSAALATVGGVFPTYSRGVRFGGSYYVILDSGVWKDNGASATNVDAQTPRWGALVY